MTMDFGEIYDRHYRPVRTFIAALVKDSFLAEDLCQETFIRVRDHLAEVRDQARLKSWVFSIAHNVCRDHFRRAKTRPEAWADGLDPESPAAGRGLVIDLLPQQELERRQMSQCVQDKIDLLPEGRRTVLVLYDIMGFSHQEVADVLRIEVGAAKVRLHRARRSFQKILEKDCDFEVDGRSVLVCEPKPNRT
ncbi:MAG: RNA polymerase sigma factor [Proteobacteria bacterium]|nr:RNA polymerase sigma factor [Pseudomonadota bacterium]MBU1742593.1 RNA polymerase sigma factor [Pseudomonadota bacterium]